MRARCVGHIFYRLWTKVHQIKCTCTWMIGVCNAVYRSTISYFIPDTFAIKFRSYLKLILGWVTVAVFSWCFFMFFWTATFLWGGGRTAPNFWPNFINSSNRFHWTHVKIRWRSTERPQIRPPSSKIHLLTHLLTHFFPVKGRQLSLPVHRHNSNEYGGLCMHRRTMKVYLKHPVLDERSHLHIWFPVPPLTLKQERQLFDWLYARGLRSDGTT